MEKTTKKIIIADKSKAFALRIIKLFTYLKENKQEYILSRQILRSGTSIGANIREAKYAHSRPDFIAKLQIALKECYETEYWLELFMKTKIIDELCYKKMRNDCGKIRKILISSINTAKSNS